MGGRVLRARSATRVGLRCGASGSQGEVTVEEAEVGVTQPRRARPQPRGAGTALAHGLQRPRLRRPAAGARGAASRRPTRRRPASWAWTAASWSAPTWRSCLASPTATTTSWRPTSCPAGMALRTGKTQHDVILKLAYDDGPDRWIEVTARPLQLAGPGHGRRLLHPRRDRTPPGRGGAAQRRAPPAGGARTRGGRLRHPGRGRSPDRRLRVAVRLVGPPPRQPAQHRLRQPARRRPLLGLAPDGDRPRPIRANPSGPSSGSSTTSAAPAGSS